MKKIVLYHDSGMWKGAPPESFGKAQELRRKMTKAESLLWEELKGYQLDGIKFRRQHPIHLFIADFYCHKYKLIIEIDGDYHLSEEQRAKDEERTKILNENGIEVIRFLNEEVENNINQTLDKIREIIKIQIQLPQP